MNLTLKSLPLFIYFFSSLEKIEIRGAIMQHILSEGLRGGGLLSYTLLITRGRWCRGTFQDSSALHTLEEARLLVPAPYALAGTSQQPVL